MEKWMKDSWKFQQEMFKMFGKRKWDSLNGSEENLKKKLVVPFEYRFGETYLSNPKFKKETLHVETRLLKLFRDKRYNQNFDCTFINLKKKDDKENEELITCVFWLQDEYGSERCVDLDGRDYESWEDFIKNNIFPKYFMIYPKYGRYYYSHKEDFADIIRDESVACSARRTVKNVFDVITAVGGAAATGVLLCNPVSGPLILGAAAVAAVSGVYGAGNSVCRLVDIEKHESGLSLKESKTLLTVGELAINVAGTAAIGVSAGIKGLTATTGKVLSEGSIAFRVANSFSKVARVVSCFNAGFSFVAVINNVRLNGRLTINDIAHISKILFYGFNIFVSDQLIIQLINFLAHNIPIERVINYLVNSFAHRAIEVVRKFHSFCSENHLNDLLELILPGCTMFLSPVLSSVKNTVNAGKQTSLSDSDRKRETELKIKKRKENEEKIKKRFEKEVYNIIEKWTKDIGIDLFDDSKFDNNINTLEEFEEKVKETVKRCCKLEESEDLQKKKEQLLRLCLSKINSEDLSREPLYAVNKMNFYCNAFESLYEDLIQACYYEYFLWFHKKNHCVNKTRFFNVFFETNNIRDHVFLQSIKLFIKDIHNLHEKFEQSRTVNTCDLLIYGLLN